MRFDTVLIANRGEIALRIIRSARAAGLRTVAVYSEADRDAPHVREADTAVLLGPAPATASYLSIPAVLYAAARTGAQAVHPGYGFLAESATFARACEHAGLVFVGPSADVIERMGRKDEARRIAVEAGVPVVPAAELSRGEPLVETAVRVGFPLMVKSAAGGGGKGMRIVRHVDDFTSALDAARREAEAAFGDDTMLLERYVERARHVEVQVFGDAHGTTVHLFDRDCSAQRRHQKVVEEAPAPDLSETLRDRLASWAVRLAASVDYVGAGTAEFLVKDEDAWFLEMNTRLQVEHPVTEQITGLDLVDLQLRVAGGEPLPFSQDDLRATGHAMEARVYAEDPERSFLPQAGVVTDVRWPPDARVDAALEPGQHITTFYDPMVAKIVVGGASRDAARRRLVDALDRTAVMGVITNTGFLRGLLDCDVFAEGPVHTSFLDEPTAALAYLGTRDVVTCAAAWWRADRNPGHPSPLGQSDGWRQGAAPSPTRVELIVDDAASVLYVDLVNGTVTGLDTTWAVKRIGSHSDGLFLEVDGQVHHFFVVEVPGGLAVAHRGHVTVVSEPASSRGAAGGEAGAEDVLAPMPGTVLAVLCGTGDVVDEGTPVLVMEAMKMELSLTAPHRGTVVGLEVTAGEHVELGTRVFSVVAAVEAGGDEAEGETAT